MLRFSAYMRERIFFSHLRQCIQFAALKGKPAQA